MDNLQSGNFGISHEAQDHSKYRLKDTTPSHGAVGGFGTGSEAESAINYSTPRTSGSGHVLLLPNSNIADRFTSINRTESEKFSVDNA
jgi:hypothetical protein